MSRLVAPAGVASRPLALTEIPGTRPRDETCTPLLPPLLDDPTINPEEFVVSQLPKLPVMVPARAGCAGFSRFTGQMLPPVETSAVVPFRTTSVAPVVKGKNPMSCGVSGLPGV